MTRILFFILFFPPALMNLMLVQVQPPDLVQYLLAAYVIGAFPAAALAFTDDVLERASDFTRATWCGVVGLVLSPLAMGFLTGTDVPRLALTAASGAIAAFLCSVALARLDRPQRKVTPYSGASTPPDLSPQPAA
jgi:Na+-driven multidrug efflux pump